MGAWMKRRGLALVVATCMFGVMAAVMAECLMMDDLSWSMLFETPDVGGKAMLWVWRAGGFVTWPVFMYLLLRPYVREHDERQRACLVRTLVVAALYGGGGLWLLSSLWTALAALSGEALALVSPFIAFLMLGMPYLYTWGFVAIYGMARDQLAGARGHDWVGRSLLATVLGVYAIGPLIYLALAMVTIPVIAAVEALPDAVAEHVMLDIFAIALSTGNFASQWFAFSRVDAHFDQTSATGEGAAAAPSAVPVAPTTTVSTLPDGTVVLPDGRLVTPDGHVYVPQAAPAASVPPVAQGPTPQVAPAASVPPAVPGPTPGEPPQQPPAPRYEYGPR